MCESRFKIFLYNFEMETIDFWKGIDDVSNPPNSRFRDGFLKTKKFWKNENHTANFLYRLPNIININWGNFGNHIWKVSFVKTIYINFLSNSMFSMEPFLFNKMTYSIFSFRHRMELEMDMTIFRFMNVY